MTLCEGCEEREGLPQVCNGDGRYHHHGMVHTYDGGLMWLCDECWKLDRAEWQAARTP